jgi:hypothetical protein
VKQFKFLDPDENIVGYSFVAEEGERLMDIGGVVVRQNGDRPTRSKYGPSRGKPIESDSAARLRRAKQMVRVKLDTTDLDDQDFMALRLILEIKAEYVPGAYTPCPEIMYTGKRSAVEAMVVQCFSSGDEEEDAERLTWIEELPYQGDQACPTK